jgi:protein-S-isoprenylcysteine O-methyltransferase Ste14
MAIEITRPKEKKPRGWGWLFGQLALFALYIVAPSIKTYFWDTGILTFGILMMGWGLMFLVGGLVTMGRSHGWWNITPFPRPVKGASLLTEGAYAYVRNPIYFGGLLLALGFALYDQNSLKIGVTILLAVFFDLKSRHEEKLLAAQYEGYAAYAAKVKRLIPGIY